MTKLSADARVRGPGAGGLTSEDDGLRVFKALSHETRTKILRLLDVREYTVSELTAEFDLAQPSISRHLSILKGANLVRRRRAGQCVYYRLAPDELSASLRGFIQRFRQCSARESASTGRRVKLSQTGALSPKSYVGWIDSR